jgi:hypothetical protein
VAKQGMPADAAPGRDITTRWWLVNLPLSVALRVGSQVGVVSVDNLIGLIRDDSVGSEVLPVKLAVRKSSLRWGRKSSGIGARVEMLTALGHDGG